MVRACHAYEGGGGGREQKFSEIFGGEASEKATTWKALASVEV
jgi:hypothetical protein